MFSITPELVLHLPPAYLLASEDGGASLQLHFQTLICVQELGFWDIKFSFLHIFYLVLEKGLLELNLS